MYFSLIKLYIEQKIMQFFIVTSFMNVVVKICIINLYLIQRICLVVWNEKEI